VLTPVLDGYPFSECPQEEVRLEVGEVLVKISQRLGEMIPVYGNFFFFLTGFIYLGMYFFFYSTFLAFGHFKKMWREIFSVLFLFRV
jgi:hypothetical protein